MFPSIYQLNHSCSSHLLLACGLLLVVLLFVHLPRSPCTAVFISPQSLCAPPPSLPLSLSPSLFTPLKLSFAVSPLFSLAATSTRAHTLYAHTDTLTCSLIYRFSAPPPAPQHVPILLALNLRLPPSPPIYPDIQLLLGSDCSISFPHAPLQPHLQPISLASTSSPEIVSSWLCLQSSSSLPQNTNVVLQPSCQNETFAARVSANY